MAAPREASSGAFCALCNSGFREGGGQLERILAVRQPPLPLARGRVGPIVCSPRRRLQGRRVEGWSLVFNLLTCLQYEPHPSNIRQEIDAHTLEGKKSSTRGTVLIYSHLLGARNDEIGNDLNVRRVRMDTIDSQPHNNVTLVSRTRRVRTPKVCNVSHPRRWEQWLAFQGMYCGNVRAEQLGKSLRGVTRCTSLQKVVWTMSTALLVEDHLRR